MPGTEYYGAEERAAVNQVLETGIFFRYNHDALRQGIWKAREMEAELAAYTGAKYAHVVSSGSTAVHCALAAAGIGVGDEVIVPPFTYIATVEAVMISGAVPVFADIDDSLCLNPEAIRQAITPRTKAVLLVHMCGAPAKMDEIVALCQEKNLVLVEDAGQALGAFYKGKSVGLFGVAGAYSFDFFKIVTAGEGGGCVTNSEQAYKHMDSFSDHGHDHIGAMRGMEQHPIVGTNYRISELHAAIGAEQMKKIRTIRADKRRNKQVLKDFLTQYTQIRFRDVVDAEGDSGTFLSFFLPDEETTRAVLKAFQEQGVDNLNYWYDNMYHYIRNWDHLKEMRTAATLPLETFDYTPDYSQLSLPQSDYWIARLISMGIKGTWTEAELQERCAKMAKALDSVLSPVAA